MSYIELPPHGSLYFADPVPTTGDLPTTDPAGTVRLVTGAGDLYWYNGSSWVLLGSFIDSVTDSDSIDFTVSSGALSADVRLSSDLADANYILGEIAIRSGASKGLRSQIANSLIRGLFSGSGIITYNSGTGDISLTSATVRALLSATSPLNYNNSTGVFTIDQADTDTSGYLSFTDWNTFNSKEPAIAAGTTTQYWRGDKSFQTLNIAALLAYTDGSSASAGQINQLLTGTQATNTTTGVAASGLWGNATSVSLTAGRWAIQGVAGFNENGAVLTTAVECGISASSSGAGIDEFETTVAPFLVSSTSDALLSTPVVYVSLSGTTTYYLNTRFYYSSGTPRHRGRIKAVRIG